MNAVEEVTSAMATVNTELTPQIQNHDNEEKKTSSEMEYRRFEENNNPKEGTNDESNNAKFKMKVKVNSNVNSVSVYW